MRKEIFFLNLSLSLSLLPVLASAQPIALHPDNPHYFVFRGKPTVIVSSAEHYGAVINPDFDYMLYLNTLARDGMNYTRLFTGSYFEKEGSFGIEKNTLAPAPGKALVPWKRSSEPGALCGGNKFDLSQWDNNYFTRLKSFVSEASKKGIIVEVTLFSSIYGYWDIQPWNKSNNINITEDIPKLRIQTLNNGSAMKYQEDVVRKIVRELNEYDNVIFEIQNEPWSDHPVTAVQKSEYFSNSDFRDEGVKWRNAVDLANRESLDWQKRIASIIADEEKKLKNRHLIAQNYCNFYFPVSEVDPLVSVMNFHYAYPVVVEQNYNYNRVIAFDESGFAGNEDYTYRKQAWKFIIAGGGLFNNLDYSFAVGYENGTAENKAPGGGSPALRRQLKVLSDFIHSYHFVKMKPDNTTIIQAPGAFASALSEPGRQYAFYLYSGNKCSLKINIPEGTYKAEWISTADGTALKSDIRTPVGGQMILVSPDYKEDIALKLIRQ